MVVDCASALSMQQQEPHDVLINSSHDNLHFFCEESMQYKTTGIWMIPWLQCFLFSVPNLDFQAAFERASVTDISSVGGPLMFKSLASKSLGGFLGEVNL